MTYEKTILWHKLVYFNVTCFIIDTKLWMEACYTLYLPSIRYIFRLNGWDIEVFVA